jgi:hypothetical protein
LFKKALQTVQVSRQTQFAFWQLKQLAEEEEANVKLEPIALTHEQVVEWRIPRKPIKHEDLRTGDWEDRFGEGAAEIDAWRPGIQVDLPVVPSTSISSRLTYSSITMILEG